jgi:O-antigen/teichoic acid export membrane protein
MTQQVSQTRGSRRLRPFGATGGTIATGLLGQVFLIVSGVFAARLLGAEDRGHLALLVLVPAALAQIGALGLPVATTFYIAQNPQNARAIVCRLARVYIAQAALLLAVHAVILVVLIHFSDIGLAPALLTLAVIPSSLAQQYGLAIFQGTQAFRRFNILRILPGGFYALGLTVLAIGGLESLVIVTAIWVGTTAVAAISTAVTSARALPEESAGGPSIREMCRFGGRALIDATSPVEAFRVDQAVVGVFLSPTVLGLYVVALAFTNLPRFISQSIGMVAYPRIAALPLRHARREIWRYVAVVVVIAGVAVVLLEGVMSRLVPLFFGSEFAPAVPLARILLVASFLVAIRRVLADGLRGTGRPGLGSLAEVSSWVVLFPALAAFAAIWGGKGVALALLLAASVSLVVLIGASSLPVIALRRLGALAGIFWVGVSCVAAGAALTVLPERGGLLVAAAALLIILLALAEQSWLYGLLCLAVFALPLTTVRVLGSIGNVSDALLFLVFAAVLLRAAVCSSGHSILALGERVGPILLLAGAGITASFRAIDPSASIVILAKILFVLWLLPNITAIVVETPSRLRRLVWVFVAAACVASAAALSDAFLGSDWQARVTGTAPSWGRYAGLTGHPNDLGLLAALGITAATGLYLTGSGRSRLPVFLSAFALSGGGLLVSGSIGGLVAGVAGVGIALAMAGRRSAVRALVACVVVVGIATGASAYLQGEKFTLIGRLHSNPLKSETLDARRRTNSWAIGEIEKSPFVGYGMDQVGTGPTHSDALPAIHNIWLQTWYVAGIAGVLALIGYYFVVWRARLKIGRHLRIPLSAMLGVWLVGMLASPDIYSRFGMFGAYCLLAASLLYPACGENKAQATVHPARLKPTPRTRAGEVTA